eukprot:scaffold50699_cov31-Tisochrysis_lutea.AAC.3
MGCRTRCAACSGPKGARGSIAIGALSTSFCSPPLPQVSWRACMESCRLHDKPRRYSGRG